VLVLTDISIYKLKHLSALIETLNDFVLEKYEKNKLLLCANPLLSICLCAELVKKIGHCKHIWVMVSSSKDI